MVVVVHPLTILLLLEEILYPLPNLLRLFSGSFPHKADQALSLPLCQERHSFRCSVKVCHMRQFNLLSFFKLLENPSS